jgi:hypothetical protein
MRPYLKEMCVIICFLIILGGKYKFTFFMGIMKKVL